MWDIGKYALVAKDALVAVLVCLIRWDRMVRSVRVGRLQLGRSV